MGPGKLKRLAQEIRQSAARLDTARHSASIDRHADIDRFAHESCLMIWPSNRPSRTRAR